MYTDLFQFSGSKGGAVCSQGPSAITWVCNPSTMQVHSWVIFINLPENHPLVLPLSKSKALEKLPLWHCTVILCHLGACSMPKADRSVQGLVILSVAANHRGERRAPPRTCPGQRSVTQVCISPYRHRTFCLPHPFSEANPAHTWMHSHNPFTFFSCFVFFDFHCISCHRKQHFREGNP